MKFWILLIAGAVGPFLFTSTLPNAALFALLPLMAVPLILPAARPWCVLPVFFLLTTCAINQRIADRLPPGMSGDTREISGVVASLPARWGGRLRFVFRPDAPGGGIPRRIIVSWYENRYEPGSVPPPVRAGERWRLLLELHPPRGTVNFHGADTERWYFTNGFGARALVKDGANELLAGPGPFNLHHWRETVLGRMQGVAGEVPAFRVLAALAVADRRGLQRTDRALLSATGTGHLLAISGLHVGLAAALGFLGGRLGTLIMPYGFRQGGGSKLPWLAAWLAALAYAALAGFGVATQRALIMLSVGILAVMSRRKGHPIQAWLVAMALVLLADPFAPLRAGFWFSFTAVAVLLWLFVPRHGAMRPWRRAVLAQAGISLAMAPLGMYWFQQASLPGFLANLVAIPVVSMLVVPLVLLALPLLWMLGPLAHGLLAAAGHVVQALFVFLEQLARFQPGLLATTRTPGLAAMLAAMLGGLILALPRGMAWRYLGVLLIVPLLLPAQPRSGAGDTRVDLLDVGQGLAVLLTGPDLQLLYDTGPGNGMSGELGWDVVDTAIRPMVTSSGDTPDLVVASHADLDHSGGLQRLLDTYPGAGFLGSFPERMTGVEPCTAPRAWRSGHYALKVLHPSRGLPYLGNASSCVLSVKGPGFSILLGGDIDASVEKRLVGEGLGRHGLLVAPHHGSSTSSTVALLNAIRPALALVSAGTDNRFGLPHADVVKRFARAGVRVLNTAHCGGVRITVNEDGLTRVQSARVERAAIWRYPPGDESCSDPRPQVP